MAKKSFTPSLRCTNYFITLQNTVQEQNSLSITNCVTNCCIKKVSGWRKGSNYTLSSECNNPLIHYLLRSKRLMLFRSWQVSKYRKLIKKRWICTILYIEHCTIHDGNLILYPHQDIKTENLVERRVKLFIILNLLGANRRISLASVFSPFSDLPWSTKLISFKLGQPSDGQVRVFLLAEHCQTYVTFLLPGKWNSFEKKKKEVEET